MKIELTNMGLLSLIFLILFALSEILYHFFKVKVEYSRKLSHIGTGIICILFPMLLKSHWSVLILCGLFAVLLLLSIKFNLLKSINSIDRKSAGSVCYPAAVYFCFLFATLLDRGYLFYYLPLIILAICDPLAALTGKKWPLGPFVIFGAKKTFLGSTIFFLGAILVGIIIWGILYGFNSAILQLPIVIAIAFFTTLAEAISKDGYDNLTIPLSAILCLYIFH